MTNLSAIQRLGERLATLQSQRKEQNMVIIFNGNTLDLLKRLQQFSDKDQKLTLDFMMQNFKIMQDKEETGIDDSPPVEGSYYKLLMGN